MPYSHFHISGVHYFTVSCVLVPSMAVIWFLRGGVKKRWQAVLVFWLRQHPFWSPVLCVSRFQLIFAVILAVLTFMQVSGKKRLRYLFGAGGCCCRSM